MDSKIISGHVNFNEENTFEKMASGDAPKLAFIHLHPVSEHFQELTVPNSLEDLLPAVDTGIAAKHSESPVDLHGCTFSYIAPEKVLPEECRVETEIHIKPASSQTLDDLSSQQENDGLPLEESQETEDTEVKIPDMKAIRESIESLTSCELCQDLLIKSETIHSCDFGHLFCGNCFSKGYRVCTICKGLLLGHNEALKNVLRRLHNLEPVSPQPPVTTETTESDVQQETTSTPLRRAKSKYFCYKTVFCPELNCGINVSYNYFVSHFSYDHNSAPVIALQLYDNQIIALPRHYYEQSSYKVLGIFELKVPGGKDTMGLFQDYIPCCLQCGIVEMREKKGLVIWMSCFFETIRIPPIIYNIRATTQCGLRFFQGYMRSLHSCQDPSSILEDSRCLLLLPKDLDTLHKNEEDFLELEVQFCLQ